MSALAAPSGKRRPSRVNPDTRSKSQQKPNNGGENSGSAVELGYRLEKLLPVLIEDLDGDDWA